MRSRGDERRRWGMVMRGGAEIVVRGGVGTEWEEEWGAEEGCDPTQSGLPAFGLEDGIVEGTVRWGCTCLAICAREQHLSTWLHHRSLVVAVCIKEEIPQHDRRSCDITTLPRREICVTKLSCSLKENPTRLEDGNGVGEESVNFLAPTSFGGNLAATLKLQGE